MKARKVFSHLVKNSSPTTREGLGPLQEGEPLLVCTRQTYSMCAVTVYVGWIAALIFMY